MNTSFAYYIFVLIGIIVAVIILKKVASCLIKTIALAVIVAALAFIYFSYFY